MDKPKFLSQEEFLNEQFAKSNRTQRLAVKASVPWGAGAVLDVLNDFADSLHIKLEKVIEQSAADLSDHSRLTAVRLLHAEINKTPPQEQVKLLLEAPKSTLVVNAVLQQRRIAPELQKAVVEHCTDHVVALRTLATRADATIEALHSLSHSDDRPTRVAVAANLGQKMRLVEPGLQEAKQAVFDSLLGAYDPAYGQHLVPVCSDPDALQAMFNKTPKLLGNFEVFVENPCVPDELLIRITAATSAHVTQRDVVKRAEQLLLDRASHQPDVMP